MVSRRSLLSWAVGAALVSSVARRVAADTPRSDELVAHDLRLPGDPTLAQRALVLVPTRLAPGTRLPLLVLLHGLGETGNELLGIHAWGERYGLVRCYERLRRPPLARILPGQRYLGDQRLAELNTSLGQRPLRGLIIACPVTPNPHRPGPAARVLDRYAGWIEETLIPAVGELAPVARGIGACGLDGCSLGGYVALELFMRKPELFSTLGTVQGAFSAPAALRYARQIAGALQRVGPRPLHIETSSQDPYRRANLALSEALHNCGVPHEFVAPPGPHNQPWLREVGTLEMLLWHDRQLGARLSG